MKIEVLKRITAERTMYYVFDLPKESWQHRGDLDLDGDEESGNLVLEGEIVGHYHLDCDEGWDETDEEWDYFQVIADDDPAPALEVVEMAQPDADAGRISHDEN